MNTTVQIFENSEFGAIRTMSNEQGEPLFCAKEVAVALGYSNPQKAIRDHVEAEDRTVNKSFTVNGTQAILINESGLYALILSSKLESARRFKHWVTAEVLPQEFAHDQVRNLRIAQGMKPDPRLMLSKKWIARGVAFSLTSLAVYIRKLSRGNVDSRQ